MKKVYLEPNLIIACRLSCFLLLFIYGFDINYYSIVFMLLTILTFSCLDLRSTKRFEKIKIIKDEDLEKPFKSLKKHNFSQLSQPFIEKAKEQLFEHFLLDYSFADSLKQFKQIQENSQCIFSRRANLWGSPLWNESLTVRENIELIICPVFILFCNFCVDLKLDGFVIQLPGDKYGKDIKSFAKIFNQVLRTLSDFDPCKKHCMNKDVSSKSWVFEFNKVTFFISTFAPFYPESHSRYTFGLSDCFLLFQPEISFAFHNLPSDTPETNWSSPRTVRDKIRVAFKEAGREYSVSDNFNFSMSLNMIEPINKHDKKIKWWTYD